MKIVSISFFLNASFFHFSNHVQICGRGGGGGSPSILWGPLGLVLWPAQSAQPEGGRKRVGGGGRCGNQREPPALLLCAGCSS